MMLKSIQSKILVVLLPLCMLITAVFTSVISPKVVEAATLFTEDFEDGDANGWANSGSNAWSIVADGSYVRKMTYVSGNSTSATTTVGSATWTDYQVQARLKVESGDKNVTMYGRYGDGSNNYSLQILPNTDEVKLQRNVSGTTATLAAGTYTLDTGVYYTIKFVLDGSSLSGYVNGDLVVGPVTDTSHINGKIGFRSYKTTYCYDDVEVSDIGANYTAFKVVSPITVDGNLDESVWNLTESASKVVSGTSDNTVTFAALWDDKNLYVAAKVLDGNCYNDSGSDSWEDDSIEIFLDSDHNHSAPFDYFDRQFRKRFNDTGLSGSNAQGVSHAWKAITGGYTVEVAIPWRNLNITPTANRIFGFDIANNDDDNGSTREGQLVWAGTGDNYKDTTAFSDLILSGTTVGTAPSPTPTPPTTNRYVTPNGAGTKDGTSWANAMQGNIAGGLQAAWNQISPDGTLYIGSGTYNTIQALVITSGGYDSSRLKKIVGSDTGGGLPVFVGDFALTNQVNRKLIELKYGASNILVQDLKVNNYMYPFYADGWNDVLRINNLDTTECSDGIYFYGGATQSNGTYGGSHDIEIQDCDAYRFTKRGIRFRQGCYNASVTNCVSDAGGADYWHSGNFPFGFSVGNSPQDANIFDHDITFTNCIGKNSYHENGTGYWNGDGFCAERCAYNLVYESCKAFNNTDGGWDDKSTNPQLINCVSFKNKRNYRFWSNEGAVFTNCISGYAQKYGGSGAALSIWVRAGTRVTANFCTLYNTTGPEVELEGPEGTLPGGTLTLNDCIIAKDNGSTSLYTTPSGSTLILNRCEEYVAGVQGTDPQFVNGSNSDWSGIGYDFNSQTYTTTKGYYQP